MSAVIIWFPDYSEMTQAKSVAQKISGNTRPILSYWECVPSSLSNLVPLSAAMMLQWGQRKSW